MDRLPFAHGWRRTLVSSVGLGMLAYLISSAAAIRVDQPFGPVLGAELLLLAPVRAHARG